MQTEINTPERASAAVELVKAMQDVMLEKIKEMGEDNKSIVPDALILFMFSFYEQVFKERDGSVDMPVDVIINHCDKMIAIYKQRKYPIMIKKEATQ